MMPSVRTERFVIRLRNSLPKKQKIRSVRQSRRTIALKVLNQTGAKGSIAGAELITKDEAKGIKNQIMTGSYLRPFTVEFTASLKF